MIGDIGFNKHGRIGNIGCIKDGMLGSGDSNKPGVIVDLGSSRQPAFLLQRPQTAVIGGS